MVITSLANRFRQYRQSRAKLLQSDAQRTIIHLIAKSGLPSRLSEGQSNGGDSPGRALYLQRLREHYKLLAIRTSVRGEDSPQEAL